MSNTSLEFILGVYSKFIHSVVLHNIHRKKDDSWMNDFLNPWEFQVSL